MTAPKKPGARKRAPKDEAIPTESEDAVKPPEPPEPPWGAPEDIPHENSVTVSLPVQFRRVKVRFLSNLEAAKMAMLPDLARFSELMLEYMVSQEKEEELSEEEQQARALELTEERFHYMEMVAHLCVLPSPGAKSIAKCKCKMAPHPPVMWTLEQAGRLDQRDLGVITHAAERIEALEAVRPLSQGQMDGDSQPPATTGESTPQTNSSDQTPPS